MKNHVPSLALNAINPDIVVDPEVREISHFTVGAHHDDLEFNTLSAISRCRSTPGETFGGVVCTDGRGSARTGPFATMTSDALAEARIAEQRRAAEIGNYRALFQLGYSSAQVRDPAGRRLLVADLVTILRRLRPRVLYIHNLLDKHPTHLAVAAASLLAVRTMPAVERPVRLLGYEGWRSLDWVPDRRKVLLDAGADVDFAGRLFSVFETQIAGGKRYDRAVLGRKFANATLLDPHAVDAAEMVETAMDLTPLILDDALDPVAFVLGFIDEFRAEADSSLQHFF